MTFDFSKGILIADGQTPEERKEELSIAKRRVRSNRHYRNHKKEVLEYHKERYKDDPSKHKDWSADWYANNRERKLEYMRKHKAKDPEKFLQRQREYYQRNKERILELARKRRKDKIEKEKQDGINDNTSR